MSVVTSTGQRWNTTSGYVTVTKKNINIWDILPMRFLGNTSFGEGYQNMIRTRVLNVGSNPNYDCGARVLEQDTSAYLLLSTQENKIGTCEGRDAYCVWQLVYALVMAAQTCGKFTCTATNGRNMPHWHPLLDSPMHIDSQVTLRNCLLI